MELGCSARDRIGGCEGLSAYLPRRNSHWHHLHGAITERLIQTVTHAFLHDPQPKVHSKSTQHAFQIAVLVGMTAKATGTAFAK